MLSRYASYDEVRPMVAMHALALLFLCRDGSIAFRLHVAHLESIVESRLFTLCTHATPHTHTQTKCGARGARG